MSKLDLASRIPLQYERQTFADVIRAITGQLNTLSEGRLAARYNAQSTVPNGSVSYAVGDFVPDSNCTVNASVTSGLGASYIRLGWVCTVAGTPGTLQEVRILTGGGTGYPTASPLTASLGANVSLNNTANYFDGPSIPQGTSGTWYVSGNVVIADTAGAANFSVKLWDGTTVIDSARAQLTLTNIPGSVHLSGFIANPAGNLRISVKDESSTSGVILFNNSGNSRDATITAFRIA